MRVAFLAIGLAGLAACFDPSYDNPTCGPAGECPSGTTCVGGTCRSDEVDGPIAIDAAGDGAIDSPIDGPDIDSAIDGPPTTGCSGSLFCEDFEALTPGPAPGSSGAWTTTASNGALTIDVTHAHGGKALRVHTTSNGFGYLQVTAPFAISHAYGRLYAWVAAFPTAPLFAHFTLVEAAGTAPEVLRPVGGQRVSTGAFWGVGSDGGPTGDWITLSTSAPTMPGSWQCFEFEIDSAAKVMNVWIDGQPHPELTVNSSMHGGASGPMTFPPLNSVKFGWFLYQANPTPNQYDVWIDDLAVGSSRIGC